MFEKPKNIKSWKQIPTRITPNLRSLLEEISKKNGCSIPVASNILANKFIDQREELKQFKKKVLGFDFKI